MRILTINPGSTSTKVVLFEGGKAVRDVDIQHAKTELAGFRRVIDQLDYRRAAVRAALRGDAAERPTDVSESPNDRGGAGVREGLGPLDAVVGRGGLLAPMPGGTYAVDDAMLDDLRTARHGEHSSNLGAILALEFARELGCPAYVVDPIVTDELDPVARVTGLPGVERRSVFHALSQRGAAREAARRLKVRYEDENFIVAHLGGGISIGAHRRGRVVDVVNALDGEGPFSPERSGTLPVQALLGLVARSDSSPSALGRLLATHAGLYALLGTNDLRQVEAMVDGGDQHAGLVFAAMAYNVAKHIASLAPVFADQDTLPLRAVVLTGGMAKSPRLTTAIATRVAFLAPVVVVTGLEEMAVMAAGAERVLRGEALVQRYQP